MSGQTLVDTLKCLHFPGVNTLDPQSLDWTFEHDSLSPMLEWFCHNVNQSNYIEPAELEEYEKICASGNVVLQGRQLEEALSNLEYVRDDSVSEESLREEVQHLESNLQHYKTQKTRLTKRRQLLSTHHNSLSHRVSKLGGVEARVKQDYKTIVAQIHVDNTQMNESLEKLSQSVNDMNQLYETVQSDVPSSGGRSGSPCQTVSMFLSQVPVQQYYSTEEAFTKQLTAYTKKQFFQGIAEMASSSEDSRFEILEVSDPDSLLVRGESQDVNIRDCKELARLQALYIQSETDRIKALCELKRLKGHKQCVDGILESLKSGSFSTDMAKNKESLQKFQSSSEAIHRDYVHLGDTEVPHLIQECRDAKVLRVLTGDYNLKLTRQDYFTSNQDKVINELIKQRSRNEFVTMALEVELRRHRELHHILTSLYTQLHKQYTQAQARLSVMGDSSLTSARHKRETVDSRDKSTARLYHVLDERGEVPEKQLFLTYSSLVDNAQRLQQKYKGLKHTLANTTNTDTDTVQLLEQNGSMCEDLVYSGSSTTSGQPLLTPRPILDAILQLKDMLKQLEQGIMDVVKEVDGKKKLLKNDSLVARERKLYTYFFTNPDKLQKTLDEISTRLQAEKHMDKTDHS